MFLHIFLLQEAPSFVLYESFFVVGGDWLSIEDLSPLVLILQLKVAIPTSKLLPSFLKGEG